MSWLGSSIAVLVFLFAIALFLTVKGRGALQNFSLTAASVLIVLLLCEIATTALAPPHKWRTIVNLDNSGGKLIAHRPVIGWGPSAPGNYRFRQFFGDKLIYDVTYTIDNDLLRKVDSGSSGKGVAFLGDSFIFGEGVRDSDTLPQRFANLEDRASPVYNLGFSAYSPAQALAEMRAGLYDKQLFNSRLIVEFVAPWHTDRVSCLASYVAGAPRFVQQRGQVIQVGTCAAFQSILSFFSTYRFFRAPTITSVTGDDVALLTGITQQVIHLAHEKYHVPIVIYYKRTPDFFGRLPDWSDDKIMQIFRNAGAEVLEYDQPPGPKYTIPHDGHPTGATNILCARKLYDFIREKFPNAEAAATQ